ncbi:nuclear pore protein [Beauveria bassiana ARSEF 2860]|uniref:Nuclear pore protein n=1 Tax=Beauveria bassiana (strain ARSEF 2860) TaxID=655819 RepID=J5JB94_BEAB2|nr:nuclear pore protein [Beauveria bassiana ARSEF 2860]EJP63393.1 nuclear pore protein [Beauveria bassiana ARSEF 2860]
MSICESTVIFDNHGDIEVQVSGDTSRYVVCSRALARMSPVLRSQTRQDSVPDTQDRCNRRRVILELNGNDDDSLTILFNIAHAHFLAVPRTLSIKQMYNLSILTSRYQCTSILGPWVESWIAGVEGTVRRDDMAMVLWVFWELGFSDNFRTMAHRVTVELDACEFTNGNRLWSSARATSLACATSEQRLYRLSLTRQPTCLQNLFSWSSVRGGLVLRREAAPSAADRRCAP